MHPDSEIIIQVKSRIANRLNSQGISGPFDQNMPQILNFPLWLDSIIIINFFDVICKIA